MIVVLLALLLAPTAHAWVPPGATIASASLTAREQGDDSSASPALSADGRYVAFRTAARNLFPSDVADPPGKHYRGGVFRRDLVTGALELVALGDLVSDADETLLTRGADSPSISADGRSVVFSTAERLVAEDSNDKTDIYLRDMQSGALELISTGFAGAEVTANVAMSADAAKIVFRTVDGVAPFQVYVRDRAAQHSTLVTHLRGDPSTPVGGALGQAGISADGTTVIWTGRNASAMVATVPNESLDPNSFSYLWQRTGEETRRITGATDPDDPGCVRYVPDDVATGPCYGPLADIEQGVTGILSQLPALSADGRTVAFVTSTSPRPRVAGSSFDLFVTDMSPGVTRKAGTVELTRDDPIDATAGASIASVALSADGRWAAFVSSRLRFSRLTLTSGVRSVFGTDELYLVDLQNRTIERAVKGADGADANGTGVGTQLALSADGHRVAFTSGADNLFFGDANQRTDVFVVDRLDAAPPPAAVEDPPVDPPLEPVVVATRASKLGVTVRRAPAYMVRLTVKAPVKGSLRVQIRGRVPDADGRPRGASKLLATRTVKVKKTGSLRIDVKLAKKYRSALRRAGKIEARATAQLTGPTVFERSVTVKFSAPR